MSDDIRLLLRSADGGPAAPDHGDIRRRARRITVARSAAVVTALVVVTAGIAGAVVGLGTTDTDTAPIIDDPPPAPTERDRDDDAAEVDDTDPADGTTAGELPVITLAETGRRLLVVDGSGVLRVDGGGERRIWDGAVLDAAPDLAGGIVVHETDETASDEDAAFGFGTIRWLPQDASAPAEPPIADQQERAVLHGVALLDGEPNVLFTRRSGDLHAEDQEERLHARVLGGDGERDLGVTGAYESGLGAVGVTDEWVVTSQCHLQCRIARLRTEDVTAVTELQAAGPHYGLDVATEVGGWITVEPGSEAGDAPEAELTLVLHDLRSDERRSVPVATLPHQAHTVTVSVLDLDPDLTAALAQVSWHDRDTEQHEQATLFVDQLDTDPTAAWLDTDARVRFDVPPDDDGDGRADHAGAPTAVDQQLVQAFLDLAASDGRTAADVPFADEVALGLGPDLHVTRAASELVSPDAWVVDAEFFRAHVGPFSALEVAADANGVVVSVGDHPHCASPPEPPPAELADLRRVSVQPDLGPDDSCLRWWTVDLFVMDDGRVAGITLDLWEP